MTVVKDGIVPDPPGIGRNAFVGYIGGEVIEGDHSDVDVCGWSTAVKRVALIYSNTSFNDRYYSHLKIRCSSPGNSELRV